MWIYSIKAAIFTNNITAKYYRVQDVWAQPYQVVHGEPFADSSIVVPFGCGALILRDSDDRPKFRSKCTLMIFLHYADEHPMFTYAFFSPRTKRVLYRQDAIFLPSLFPMRLARQASGLETDGDALTTFRSPASLRDGSPPDLSFGNWTDTDSLPDFDDDVTGFSLGPPSGSLVREPREIPELPVHIPNHPGFGPSAVVVPIPASSLIGVQSTALSNAVAIYNHTPREFSLEVVRDAPSPDGVTASTAQRVMMTPHEATYGPHLPQDNSDAVGSGGEGLPMSLPSLQGEQQSGDDGIPPPPVGPPPPERGREHDVTAPRARFRLGLTLTFPDGERCDQGYSAHPGWTVPEFRVRMASLLGTTSPISVTVSPGWDELDRLGPISAAFLPDSTVPCPHLVQNSVVRVRQSPPWPGGPTSPELPIQVTLTFPDEDRSDLPFAVLPRTTIPQLSRVISELFATSSQVVLRVSPEWDELTHLGVVSAHVFPGLSTPCPRLKAGSIVQVRRVRPSSSDVLLDGSSDIFSAEGEVADVTSPVLVAPSEIRRLRALFRREAKRERALFKDNLVMEWHRDFPSMGDKENLGRAVSSDFDDDEDAFENFVAVRLAAHDRWASEKRADFFASIKSRPPTPTSDLTSNSERLRNERTLALWEGLRRRFFGEAEADDVFIEEDHDSSVRDQLYVTNQGLRDEISELLERIRRRRVLVPMGSPPPPPVSDDTHPDDPPPNPPMMLSSQTPLPATSSHREPKEAHEHRRSSRIKRGPGEVPLVTRRKAKDRWYYEPISAPPKDPFSTGGVSLTNRNALVAQHLSDSSLSGNCDQARTKKGLHGFSSTNENVSFSEEPSEDRNEFVWLGERKTLISQRTLRKILAAKETLFKFGTFVPRNEAEASRSPEAPRWMAGRDLEWLRMGHRETFGRDWTWDRIQREFPNYLKSEIGHLFYVFDFKYSGEHRVRLVFDGSRQSPATYK